MLSIKVVLCASLETRPIMYVISSGAQSYLSYSVVSLLNFGFLGMSTGMLVAVMTM